MTELPKVAYKCPTCNRISDTVNAVVPVERVTPYTYDVLNETHRPDLMKVKNNEGFHEWRCVLCGAEIVDIDRSLVDVFTTPTHPPAGFEPDPMDHADLDDEEEPVEREEPDMPSRM